MSLSSATPAVLAFARYFSRPCCPLCGEEQLVPEHSAFAGQGRVHHLWACEECGHAFRTTLKFGRKAA